MAADNAQQDASQFTKIYTLSLPAGIKRDGTIFETNEYSDGVWCRFQRGQPKKMGGYRQIFNTHVGIYRGMIAQPNNGVNYIFTGNYEELNVFTTNTNYALGSGPYAANILLGTVWAAVKSNTTTDIIVAGDVTTVFPSGTQVLFAQSTNPTIYEVDTVTYNSGTDETTIVLTSAMPAGTVTKIWIAEAPFTGDPDNGPYRTTWQFDGVFNPLGDDLNILAHPGKNLINIDNGVKSQVLIGPITPDSNNQWNFTGLSDSEGQNPTYQPVSVDGGACMLYPFIFVYGSHGFIANNNVDNTNPTVYDWNGPLANQVNVAASKIVKGMPMRGGTNSPSGLFWATDSLIRVSFNPQATSNYWTYDIVSSQISIMSSNAVVEMDGTFFWMGVDRFYLYNGQVAVLPNDKNLNWLYDNINYGQRQKVWATKIPRYNEIWFFYPRGTATECTDAIIYNVKDKIWYDAGSAVGARRSCGYTTEILPTPLWAGWEYNPIYSNPFTVVEHPASLSAPATNQFYLAGDQTPAFPPGSWVTALPGENWNNAFEVESSEHIYNTTIGTPGVTLITMKDYTQSALSPRTYVYNVTEGYSIWQHEFGQNAVSTTATTAVQSSITTSDISWISGSPGGENLIGLNRRMHLRRVEPNFLQTGEMSMEVLGRKFANGAVNIENSGPFYFSPQDGKIDLRVEHRLVRLKFESNTVDGNFEMGRLVITAEFGDERP